MDKISLHQGHRKATFTVVVLIINIVKHFVIVVVVSENFYFKSEREGPEKRVPNRFFGIRDLASLKVGIRDFSGKERRYSGLELGTGRGI